MSILELGERPQTVTRRGLLVGGGAIVGLAIGYALWPRSTASNLVAGADETLFEPWLKIGRDGRVTVAVPQLEAGQGSYTAIAQIVADELGADWRTIAIEPAPLNPAYDNALFAGEAGIGDALQATGFSTSIRALEAPARQAAAAARVLLCKAAAARWDADWTLLDTDLGFVVEGTRKLRFGELAEEAAALELPSIIPLKAGGENRLMRRGMARLDLPAKIDGSANFAADIRLPDMVFASIRQGPPGDARLVGLDRAATQGVLGLLEIVEHEHWVAAVATNWWAANKAIEAMRPRFGAAGRLVNDDDISKALDAALDGDGERIAKAGDVGEAFAGARVIRAQYDAGLAPHAVLEPFAATAWLKDGRLQLWLATQWQGVARAAAADAIGLSPSEVTVHVTLGGGSFGRNLEVEIARQAAILAQKLERPVQLQWSRAEDMLQDRFRPPARARMIARLGRAGQIEGWQARIAVPDALGETLARNLDGDSAGKAQRALASRASPRAVSGAVPPYAIPAYAIDHHPADIGLPSGVWRGAGDGFACYCTEAFIDELSQASGVEPFSFRMASLGGNPRLAYCLTRVTARGGWEGGGQGTGQGLACHSMRGSHVAVLAEARLGDDGRVKVAKLACVVDAGRIINPDLARQQIEGGLLFGMAAATCNAVRIERGVPRPLRLGALGFPRLADMPEISVELIDSREASGGISEVAVPPVAPAIANALFASTGRRFRSLPLGRGK